jgi:TonB family protein
MLFGQKKARIESLYKSTLIAISVLAACNAPVWAISDDHVLDGGLIQYGAAFNKYLLNAKIDPVQRYLIRYSLIPLPGYAPSNIALANMRTPIAGFYKLKSVSPSTNPIARVGAVDFGPYMVSLQRQIKSNWFPPYGAESEHLTVTFKIETDGSIRNLKLVTASGVPEADEAGLKAVEHAARVLPLPAGAPKSVDVQFTFDYNVFNSEGHGQFRSVDEPPGLTSSSAPQAAARRRLGYRRATTSTSSSRFHDDYGYGPFLDLLELRIRKAWAPPKGEDTKPVVVLFSVDRTGKISDINLYKTSGVSGADQAAMNAVREAGIVGKPPESAGAKVNVEFTFDHKLALIKEL